MDGSKLVSQNFYWRATQSEDYLALKDMPKTQISASVSQAVQNGHSTLDIRLENRSTQIALMVCVKVVKNSTPNDRVLPIFYDDNYVSLLPGEKREVHAEFDSALLSGDRPRAVIQGWNVPAMDVLP